MHEAAHGYAANLLGDDTAKKLGRVTLNPFKHIDKFGTVILPILLIVIKSPFIFGWAKPVPVNFHRLRNPLRDMVFVALAGPVTNIIIAFVAASILSTMFNFFIFALVASLLEYACIFSAKPLVLTTLAREEFIRPKPMKAIVLNNLTLVIIHILFRKCITS